MANDLPEKLQDLFGTVLSGFQIVKGYYLEPAHGLWGFFPALIKENDEIVICLDKELAEKILQLLPDAHRAKIYDLWLLVNTGQNYAFDVTKIKDVDYQDLKPLHVLTEEEFQQRLQEEKEPFVWASGLVRIS